MKISILILGHCKIKYIFNVRGFLVGSQREALSGLLNDNILITVVFTACRTIVVPVTKVDSFFFT